MIAPPSITSTDGPLPLKWMKLAVLATGFSVPPLKLNAAVPPALLFMIWLMVRVPPFRLNVLFAPELLLFKSTTALGGVGLVWLPLQEVMAPLFRLTTFAPLLLPMLKRRSVLAFKLIVPPLTFKTPESRSHWLTMSQRLIVVATLTVAPALTFTWPKEFASPAKARSRSLSEFKMAPLPRFSVPWHVLPTLLASSITVVPALLIVALVTFIVPVETAVPVVLAI